MNTRKIIEFSSQPQGSFVRFLQFYAKLKGWDWHFEYAPHFEAHRLEGASGAWVDAALSASILEKLPMVSTQVRAIQVLDSFFPENGIWYPRLLLHEALHSVLISEARDLDIRAPALVVGEDEGARVAATVLAEIGVAHIYLVGDATKLRLVQSTLSRSQLGIQFYVLPKEALTLQAISAGVIVNASDLSAQSDLFTDLSYFNFMKTAGYAVDLDLFTQQNLLLEEAANAGLRVLPSQLILQKLTQLWLSRLGISEPSSDELHQTWAEFLKQNPSSV